MKQQVGGKELHQDTTGAIVLRSLNQKLLFAHMSKAVSLTLLFL